MELIYVWINKSENDVFSNQDVLLTDQYNIKTTVVNKGDNREEAIIDISKNEDYFNIFENGVISNVTGIVGSNGAGKTTLLNYIFNNDVELMSKNENKTFKEFYQERDSLNKTIQIFKENDEILVFHNLNNVVVKTKLEHDVINMEKKATEDMGYLDGSYGGKLTKVYLTNGNYNPEHSTSFERKNTNKIVLTLDSLETLKNKFFDQNVGREVNKYNHLQEIISDRKSVQDFQAICDVIYINQLVENKSIESFIGKIPMELEISSFLLPELLESIEQSMPDENNPIKIKIKEWNKFCQGFKKKDFEPIDFLKLNFVFEVDYCLNVITEIKDYENFNWQTDEPIIDTIYDKMKDKIETISSQVVKNYFENATDEISKVEDIFYSIVTYKDIYKYHPASSFYQRVLKLNREKNINEYDCFVKYISEIAGKKSFFILKYLRIDGLKLSSGERAFMNFFSWLNLLSFFNQISSEFIKETNKNILLLIDEIDLYCHPEWQRQFIKNLIEELTKQFKGKKIQIIFTTHSPILLSDIPKANTVYIRNNENDKSVESSSIIESRIKHEETFAGNIYKLFNDSFFLASKGAVGEYAKEKINCMYEELKKEEVNKEKKNEYKFLIDSIGEPIVKNKLNELYKKKIFNEEDKDKLLTDQQNKIEELEAKLRKLSNRDTISDNGVDND